MLSAFTAEPIVALKPRDKSKIDSILAHGDQLLVGLNSGCLRIYRVNDPPNSSDDSKSEDDAVQTQRSELLREHEKFAKYKIEQLATFKEANILISLSGGTVSIHDLGSFELQQQLSKAKGASTFAATSNIINDVTTSVPTLVSRLAVAVKRRLFLWSWHDGEQHDEVKEIACANTIKTLSWATGTTIVAGLQSSYIMLDVITESVTPITGPGSIGGGQEQESSRLGGIGAGTISYIGMGSMVPTPLITGLGQDEMLLARDINTHFIDRSGQPLGRRQIPWKSAPHAIGYSYPFLLSLQESSKGTLEVRNPQTLTILQSIELPGATLLQVPNPNISLAHQGKGFLVAGDRTVWRMKALHYDAQIDSLVASGHLDEAISLLGMIEETLIQDKEERLREIRMQKAQQYFDERRFRDALDLFGEVSAPPDRVIRLYPEVIAGDLAHTRAVSNLSKQGHHKNDPNASGLNNREDDGSSMRSTRTGPDELSEKDLKNAVRELQLFLANIRRQLQRFFNPDQSVKSSAELRDSVPDADVKRIASLLLHAENGNHADLEKRLREVAILVDTTLFRAHMFATPSLAGSLFRIANFCDPGVVMTKLEAAGRYGDLIEFLYGKRLHREALERLQKFGQEEKTEDIEPLLRGPERTVAYLQNLTREDIDLILQFARWPMEQNPDLGMQIFLADTANADELPREKVLRFLEPIDKSLALRYLEHIVDELNDDTPELHQHLLNLYFEKLKTVKGQAQNELMAKFLTMLKDSQQYSAAQILETLPRDEALFYEANALVLSRMGQHKQALKIYIFKLHDTNKAEEYCNQVHLNEAIRKERSVPGGQKLTANISVNEEASIYHILLNLYLNPPDQEKALVGPAIELMAKHGPRLPASSTLEMIPGNLLVSELEFYLRGRIRNVNSALNDNRIEAGLFKVNSSRFQAALLLGEANCGIISNGGRQRKVKIDDNRVCGVCFKRLGGSVISVFPDNSVVHLGCANRRMVEMSATTEG